MRTRREEKQRRTMKDALSLSLSLRERGSSRVEERRVDRRARDEEEPTLCRRDRVRAHERVREKEKGYVVCCAFIEEKQTDGSATAEIVRMRERGRTEVR